MHLDAGVPSNFLIHPCPTRLQDFARALTSACGIFQVP